MELELEGKVCRAIDDGAVSFVHNWQQPLYHQDRSVTSMTRVQRASKKTATLGCAARKLFADAPEALRSHRVARTESIEVELFGS